MESSKAKRILVVDDDAAVNTFLKRYLIRQGYTHVETASSGEEALEKMRAEPADVVLLDIMMPGIGGVETLRRIRWLYRNTEIIIITGFFEKERAKELLEEGAFDFIRKPFLIPYLKQAIELAGSATLGRSAALSPDIFFSE